MYLSILVLPILGAMTSGLFGRKLGVTGAQLITCICIILAALLSIVAFYEVALCKSSVSVHLSTWIDSGIMSVDWAFIFDSLTVSILLPVLIVSSIVHIYSISYISADPHNQRFFSYLSIFTFFILILVTGDNYLILFVGWEGELMPQMNTLIFPVILLCTSVYKKNFHIEGRIHSHKRVGPHDRKVIEFLVGGLLGDSHIEKRIGGTGSRFKFEQNNRNVEYLMWSHKFLVERGYCPNHKPKLIKRIRKNNTIYFGSCFNTFTFNSWNWLYEEFYHQKVKHLPISLLNEYLSPFAIAIWFIDDGSCFSGNRKGLRIATHCFNKEELISLCDLLKQKYGLECNLHKDNDSFYLFINHKTSSLFASIVKPYILTSMVYKLGIYS